MGDCSNGIEIEIKNECGAVTTKNFEQTELQLEKGSVCTAFEFRDIGAEMGKCQRRFINFAVPGGQYTLFGFGTADNTTTASIAIYLPCEMAGVPTMTKKGNISVTDASGTPLSATNVTLIAVATTRSHIHLSVTVASGLVGGNATRCLAMNDPSADIFLAYEL
jgi:hypothetical protein